MRDVLFPDVGKEVVDQYACDRAAGAARQLSADRIEAVGRYYALGRCYEDRSYVVRDVNWLPRRRWGLAPRGCVVGDQVYRMKGCGAAIVLRYDGSRTRFVGACGIDLEWLKHRHLHIPFRIS